MSQRPRFFTAAGYSPDLPESAQRPQPGFQDHPASWYEEPGRLSSEEQKKLLDYLDQLAVDLDGNDPVRWEEWGIVSDYWPGPDSQLQGRKRSRDVARWRICLELRWSNPIRLSEGLEHIEWLVAHFESHGNRTVLEDPVLLIFLAAALEMKGGHDSRALDLLSSPGLFTARNVGPRNALLGRACLSRILRRSGRVQDAIQQEEEICNWIRGHPLTMLPSQIICQLRVGGETSNHILDRLGHNHFAGYMEISQTQMLAPNGISVQMGLPGNHIPNDIFSFRPLEANKQDKHECWTSGCRSTVGLSICSKCKVALYCSVEHQRTAWPRHKQLCKSYLAKSGKQEQTSPSN